MSKNCDKCKKSIKEGEEKYMPAKFMEYDEWWCKECYEPHKKAKEKAEEAQAPQCQFCQQKILQKPGNKKYYLDLKDQKLTFCTSCWNKKKGWLQRNSKERSWS